MVFRFRLGHYLYVVMFLGLTNVPTTFVMVMNYLFQKNHILMHNIIIQSKLLKNTTIIEHVDFDKPRNECQMSSPPSTIASKMINFTPLFPQKQHARQSNNSSISSVYIPIQ